jgi:hypothetical protein
MGLASQRLRKQNLLKIISLLMFVVMGALVGISCQDKGKGGEQQPNPPTDTPTVTPVLEPGSTGTEPPKSTPVARRITGTAAQYKGTPVPCDNRRQAEVELSQVGVACAKYDFTALNNEAQALADAELNKMKCPAGAPCSIFNKFYTFWTAECKGGIATVRIKGYSLCATTTAGDGGRKGIGTPSDLTKPTDKITPAPVTMDQGENSSFHPIDDGTWFKGDINKAAKTAGVTLPCPSNALYVFTYMENNPEIPHIGIGDYGPYIERAKAQANLIFDQYVCPGTCTKTLPFTPVFVQWNVKGDYVVVEVDFMVTCK